MIELIPNCSETVHRIDLTEIEKEKFRYIVRDIISIIKEAKNENINYIENQTLERYLEAKKGESVWVSELEASILSFIEQMLGKIK